MDNSRRRIRKSTAGTRKVNHGWREEEIISLITAVEKIRALWDIGSDEYRLINRKEGWQNVADELNIDGVDACEAQTKWLSLRTTFTTNLTNIRLKGETAPYTVKWKFFGLMSFLESTQSQQQTLSASTLDYESLVSWDSCEPSPLKIKLECMKSSSPPQSPLSYHADVDNTPTTTVVNYSNSNNNSNNNNNTETAQPSANANSMFCQYLLAELQALPEKKARRLRNKLGRVMFEYMDESQTD